MWPKAILVRGDLYGPEKHAPYKRQVCTLLLQSPSWNYYPNIRIWLDTKFTPTFWYYISGSESGSSGPTFWGPMIDTILLVSFSGSNPDIWFKYEPESCDTIRPWWLTLCFYIKLIKVISGNTRWRRKYTKQPFMNVFFIYADNMTLIQYVSICL